MKSTIEIISILKRLKKDSAYKYGIKPFGIFGSFAWNQQDEASDLDVFVTLQKSDFYFGKIKEELEKLMHFKIDIINFRDSFKQYILILRVYSASQLFK